MSLTPAKQMERADSIIKKMDAYIGERGAAAHQYIKEIERQCWWSNLESQRPYVFLNTLENNDIKEWFWHLDDETRRSDWDGLKAKFLSMQNPAEYQLEIKEKWEDLVQREDQTPEAYAIELKTLMDQIDPKSRPPQIEQTLRFRQGLKQDIRTRTQARSEDFENWDEAVKEANMVATDMGRKKLRPRGLVRTSDTSLTTGDRDLKQSSAKYKEELDKHRASLIQQWQGEEKVSAISSDHRRKQDDKKKSSYPCKNGPLCKWKEKGLCKFDHSKIPTCRYGKNCK